MNEPHSSVLPFEKNVADMSPGEVFEYLAYLRRGIHQRTAEREAVDQSTLAPEAIAALTQVALSDASQLANLDRLEAQIRAELGLDDH